MSTEDATSALQSAAKSSQERTISESLKTPAQRNPMPLGNTSCRFLGIQTRPWSSLAAQSDIAVSIWLLGAFLLRTFWFIGFELGQRAATPGKRMMGIRVVARDGGRLHRRRGGRAQSDPRARTVPAADDARRRRGRGYGIGGPRSRVSSVADAEPVPAAPTRTGCGWAT